jgi:hypothetical protein
VKPSNVTIITDAIGKLSQIPLDESFSNETLELSKLVHHLVVYRDKMLSQPKKDPTKK